MPPWSLAFGLLIALLVAFVVGRPRYDVAALLALLAAALLGLVPASEAFLGFGHPAVVTVAAMLVISHGLTNAGVVSVLSGWVGRLGQGFGAQSAALVGLVTVLSGVMNNIGALALLMPVAIRVARQHQRPPSQLLMPLAFGSLLGGLLTLIGTPPNLIVAAFRAEAGGAPFGMFDFAPVGLGVAAVGVLFLVVAARRLLPHREGEGSREALFRVQEYTMEVRVTGGGPAAGRSIGSAVQATQADVVVVGLVRDGERALFPASHRTLRADDRLVVEGAPEELERFVERAGLDVEGTPDPASLGSDKVALLEVILQPDSPLVGRTAEALRFRQRYGANLLAVARSGRRLTQRLGQIPFEPGDVLLVQMEAATADETVARLGGLAIGDLPGRFAPRRGLALALAAFVAAIALTAAELVPVELAFTAVAALFVLTRVVPLRDAYTAIDWPIIVLLAVLLPVGEALETSGGTRLVADGLGGLAAGLPGWATVAVLLVGTTLLTSVINNAAAAVLMAPLAVQIAGGLGVSADPLLMAVAVGASCAFLTPVAHQSNLLVMGPGGYRFADYVRLGLPLTVLVTVVAVPLILAVWPL